mmetsp:Transcript_22956/g.58660  ORF Transcript_22956/g.58660 Transcript_22956/m.58660 type:complete len:622 (+) Transcript_22956:436-2301(+)
MAMPMLPLAMYQQQPSGRPPARGMLGRLHAPAAIWAPTCAQLGWPCSLVLGLLGGGLRAAVGGSLVRAVVHAGHRAARGVLLARPRGVPQRGRGRRARDRGATGHGVHRALLGEVLLKDGAVEVGLLGARRVVGVAVLRGRELRVRHHALGVRLEPVDPVVAHAVRELLLLPPQHVGGQVGVLGRVERLAQDVLLDAAALLVNHLLLGVQRHGHVQEVAVQEGHARLHAPRHGGLVGAQAVVLVQVLDLAHRLAVELLLGGRLVEVQVAAKHLVRALARQHHLHAQRLDLARHEEHGGGGADGGGVKGLHVVDHVTDGVNALLHGEGELVVVGAQEVSHHARGLEVGGAGQADAERVQLAPHAAVAAQLAGGHGRHQGGVQAARQQHAEGHVRHQALLHSGLKGLAQHREVQGGGGEHLGLGLKVRVELGVVVALELASLGGVEVARGELLEARAVVLQALHLRGGPHGAILAPANVQAGHANGVADNVEAVVAGVQDGEGKEAVQHAKGLLTKQLVQVADDLAVGVGGELLAGRLLQDLLGQLLVVVDLTVDSHNDGLVLVEQGLVARGGVHDSQALMGQEVVASLVQARPVRATVALATAQRQHTRTHGWAVIRRVQQC